MGILNFREGGGFDISGGINFQSKTENTESNNYRKDPEEKY